MGLLLYNGGTVCKHGFSTISAEAICKEMGFPGSSFYSTNKIWSLQMQRKYRITLYYVFCTTSIWIECGRLEYVNTKFNYSCGHRDDIFLECDGQTTSCGPGYFVYRYSYEYYCKECNYDEYKSHEGPDKHCLSCPSETESSSDRTYCICPAGTFWQEPNCLKCPSTAFSEPGSKYCSCPIGKFWDGTNCSTPVSLIVLGCLTGILVILCLVQCYFVYANTKCWIFLRERFGHLTETWVKTENTTENEEIPSVIYNNRRASVSVDQQNAEGGKSTSANEDLESDNIYMN